jgi:hypothetical protein
MRRRTASDLRGAPSSTTFVARRNHSLFSEAALNCGVPCNPRMPSKHSIAAYVYQHCLLPCTPHRQEQHCTCASGKHSTGPGRAWSPSCGLPHGRHERPPTCASGKHSAACMCEQPSRPPGACSEQPPCCVWLQCPRAACAACIVLHAVHAALTLMCACVAGSSRRPLLACILVEGV